MNKLPNECILDIFTYLNSEDLILMILINKKWKKIIENNYNYIYSKKHYFNYNKNFTFKQLYLRDYYLNNFNIVVYFNENYEIKDKINININDEVLNCFLCRKKKAHIFKHFINKSFYLNVPYCDKYCCINDFNKTIITNYGEKICKWVYINNLFNYNDNKCNKRLNCCDK